MDRNKVDKAVLVQARGASDNSYLVDCVRRFPGRLAAIGIVDVSRSDAIEMLDFWVKRGLQGIRLSSTDDPSSQNGLAILRRAEELNLVVSWLDSMEQYASNEFRELVAARPKLRIMIEHLGIFRAQTPFPEEKFRRVLSLAEYPNVYIKVPGFGEILARPVPLIAPTFNLTEVPPYIEMAREAFGADRMAIGTDYPPSAAREGYGNVIGYLRKYLSTWSKPDQEAIFSGTAASLFTFSG